MMSGELFLLDRKVNLCFDGPSSVGPVSEVRSHTCRVDTVDSVGSSVFRGRHAGVSVGDHYIQHTHTSVRHGTTRLSTI
jgi:hypothetical protein